MENNEKKRKLESDRFHVKLQITARLMILIYVIVELARGA